MGDTIKSFDTLRKKVSSMLNILVLGYFSDAALMRFRNSNSYTVERVTGLGAVRACCDEYRWR